MNSIRKVFSSSYLERMSLDCKDALVCKVSSLISRKKNEPLFKTFPYQEIQNEPVRNPIEAMLSPSMQKRAINSLFENMTKEEILDLSSKVKNRIVCFPSNFESVKKDSIYESSFLRGVPYQSVYSDSPYNSLETLLTPSRWQTKAKINAGISLLNQGILEANRVLVLQDVVQKVAEKGQEFGGAFVSKISSFQEGEKKALFEVPICTQIPYGDIGRASPYNAFADTLALSNRILFYSAIAVLFQASPVPLSDWSSLALVLGPWWTSGMGEWICYDFIRSSAADPFETKENSESLLRMLLSYNRYPSLQNAYKEEKVIFALCAIIIFSSYLVFTSVRPNTTGILTARAKGATLMQLGKRLELFASAYKDPILNSLDPDLHHEFNSSLEELQEKIIQVKEGTEIALEEKFKEEILEVEKKLLGLLKISGNSMWKKLELRSHPAAIF